MTPARTTGGSVDFLSIRHRIFSALSSVGKLGSYPLQK